MTTATIAQGSALSLPPALRTAQAAIHSAEVQEMLRRLSKHGLGICMPHMHNEQTGEFLPLAEQVMQVESGLEVSFQPSAEIAKHADRFLQVAWVWRDGARVPSAVCEMVQKDGPDDGEPPVKHKMPARNRFLPGVRPASWHRQVPLHMRPTKETR